MKELGLVDDMTLESGDDYEASEASTKLGFECGVAIGSWTTVCALSLHRSVNTTT